MDKTKKIVEILTKKNKTISTMESCTGGAIASTITNVEGASKVLRFSAITYSNEYKIKMGVSKEIIDKYSVYSKNTAQAMAKAISNYTNSNYALGITGKLNRPDDNNPAGKDNEVFYSIFDSDKNQYYDYIIKVNDSSREKNKKEIVEQIIETLYEILK